MRMLAEKELPTVNGGSKILDSTAYGCLGGVITSLAIEMSTKSEPDFDSINSVIAKGAVRGLVLGFVSGILQYLAEPSKEESMLIDSPTPQ